MTPTVPSCWSTIRTLPFNQHVCIYLQLMSCISSENFQIDVQAPSASSGNLPRSSSILQWQLPRDAGLTFAWKAAVERRRRRYETRGPQDRDSHVTRSTRAVGSPHTCPHLFIRKLCMSGLLVAGALPSSIVRLTPLTAETTPVTVYSWPAGACYCSHIQPVVPHANQAVESGAYTHMNLWWLMA